MSKKVLGVVDAVKHIDPVSAGARAVRTVVSATADEKRCPKCGSWAKQDLTGTDVMGKACAGGATVGVLGSNWWSGNIVWCCNRGSHRERYSCIWNDNWRSYRWSYRRGNSGWCSGSSWWCCGFYCM